MTRKPEHRVWRPGTSCSTQSREASPGGILQCPDRGGLGSLPSRRGAKRRSQGSSFSHSIRGDPGKIAIGSRSLVMLGVAPPGLPFVSQVKARTSGGKAQPPFVCWPPPQPPLGLRHPLRRSGRDRPCYSASEPRLGTPLLSQGLTLGETSRAAPRPRSSRLPAWVRLRHTPTGQTRPLGAEAARWSQVSLRLLTWLASRKNPLCWGRTGSRQAQGNGRREGRERGHPCSYPRVLAQAEGA